MILLSFLGNVLLTSEIALTQDRHRVVAQRIDVPAETKEYIKDLIQKGFDQRERIKSGQMVITDHLKNLLRREEVTRKITIAFDESRRRVDRHNAHLGVSYNDVGCIGCYKNDSRLILWYNDHQYNEEDVRYALTVHDENTVFKFWSVDFGFLPQYLAYFRTDRFPTKENLESGGKRFFLAHSVGMLEYCSELTIDDEEHKGVMCKKITFYGEASNGALKNTLWIAETQGYSVLKQHFLFTRTAEVFDEELLEVDVALDKDTGIWFPSSWLYEDTRGGKASFWQNGTVENVVLNKPLPETLFDIRDIKIIPAGAQVHWRAKVVPPPHGASPTGELIWDGNDIITRGMYNENLVKQAAAASKSKEFKAAILLSVLTVCVIYGILAWIWYLHLKRQSNSPNGKMLTEQHTEPDA